MKQIPSHENSVGAVENSVGARSTFYSTMYPIQCNNNYSGPSGWVKDLMIESESLRFRVSMGLLFWHNALSPAGKRDTRTHVSLGSNFLFYLICYYASVSYFLFWSNWIDFSYFILIKLMSESKRIFDEKSKCFGVRCKMFSTMFSTRQCFSLTFMKAIFTCAWAGNACLLFSIFPIITVFTRARQTALSVIIARFSAA